jgi:hypothetical protein
MKAAFYGRSAPDCRRHRQAAGPVARRVMIGHTKMRESIGGSPRRGGIEAGRERRGAASVVRSEQSGKREGGTHMGPPPAVSLGLGQGTSDLRLGRGFLFVVQADRQHRLSQQGRDLRSKTRLRLH